MTKLFKPLFSIFLFFTAVTGVSFLTSGESRAQGTCKIALTKIAEGGEGLIFEFQVEVGGDTGSAEFIGGQTSVGNFGSGEPVTLTELPNAGWELADKSCETGPGVVVTEVEDGFTFDCLNPSEFVQGECTFTNVRAASNVPTLSQWGMISAVALLGLIGVFFAIRWKRAQAV